MTGHSPVQAPPPQRRWRALLTVLGFCVLVPVAMAQKPVLHDLSIRFQGLSINKQKYLEEVMRTWDPGMYLSISVALQEARVSTRRTINAQELGEQLAPYGISISEITDTTGNGLHGPGGGGRYLPGTRANRADLMDQATPADEDR